MQTPLALRLLGAKLRYAVQLKADVGARAPGSVPSTPKKLVFVVNTQ